jgi:hypothetical protein
VDQAGSIVIFNMTDGVKMIDKSNIMFGSNQLTQYRRWRNLTFYSLIKQRKIEEAKLFEKKMYAELYDNWGILILTREMEKLLQDRWEKIHFNHSEDILFCSDFKCPKHKMILYDEGRGY